MKFETGKIPALYFERLVSQGQRLEGVRYQLLPFQSIHQSSNKEAILPETEDQVGSLITEEGRDAIKKEGWDKN